MSKEECEILWTELKEAVEDLLSYYAAVGKEYDIDEIYEMARRIVESRKRLERAKCPLKPREE